MMVFAMLVPQILSVLRKPANSRRNRLSSLLCFRSHKHGIVRLPMRNWRGARRTKIEQFELRAISSQIDGPFIAPWWFSPAVSYWSRQAGMGGSSHESIEGIVETAKFFETQDAEEAKQIINRHHITWIVSYDADRVAQNSAQILGNSNFPKTRFVILLDRRASEVPPFLRLSAQTGALQTLPRGKS